jgi:hypothetical protein
MKNRKIIISFVLVIVFFIFLLNITHKTDLKNIQEVKIAGQSIKVDLAVTVSEQEQGLSGRVDLKDNEGMLFVFSKAGKYNFWMKDMNFPIDIIWIGEDMKVVYIKKDARPELYLETYGPNASAQPAKYVFEVVAGFSDKNNLKEGDSVTFSY